MAVSRSSAQEAARAVNALLHFCEEDQQPLLDVLSDYFDSPLEGEVDSEEDIEGTFSMDNSNDRGEVCA